MGEIERARRHYARAHALYSRLEDRGDLGFVEWGLGQLHQLRGELTAAERRYRAARAAFAQAHEERGLVMTEKSMAEVLHARGRAVEAGRLFDSAVARAKASGLSAHIDSYV
jgi:tetratricopeptide (TPR) repeat protein